MAVIREMFGLLMGLLCVSTASFVQEIIAERPYIYMLGTTEEPLARTLFIVSYCLVQLAYLYIIGRIIIQAFYCILQLAAHLNDTIEDTIMDMRGVRDVASFYLLWVLDRHIIRFMYEQLVKMEDVDFGDRFTGMLAGYLVHPMLYFLDFVHLYIVGWTAVKFGCYFSMMVDHTTNVSEMNITPKAWLHDFFKLNLIWLLEWKVMPYIYEDLAKAESLNMRPKGLFNHHLIYTTFTFMTIFHMYVVAWVGYKFMLYLYMLAYKLGTRRFFIIERGDRR